LDHAAFYQALPDQWLERTSGEAPWARQSEIMRALVRHRRVAVASANSCGKSFIAARIAIWWLSMYKPSVVITTAPTERQVSEILWREIRIFASKAKASGNALGGKLLLTNHWEFAEDHFAIGFSTKDNDADKFQGFHSPHLLVIADEAAGISEKIFEGVTAVLKGAHTRLLAIGNPTTLEGWFYAAFKSQGWYSTHISAFDTPNVQQKRIVIPGLVTGDDVEQARIDYGEGSPLWQARILGQFPDRLDDTMIAIRWVEEAAERRPDLEGEIVVGADIARGGSDSTVFIARQGMNAFASEEHNQKDTMESTGLLATFCNKLHANRLQVDAVGLGAGVVDRLRELMPDFEIIEMGAGTNAHDDEHFANAGAEWYAGLAEMLRDGRVGGEVFRNKRVVNELTSRKRRMRSDGRYELEAKKEILKRGGKSPDWGDALAMCFAPRPKTGAEGLLEFYRQQLALRNAPVTTPVPNPKRIETLSKERVAEEAPKARSLIDSYVQTLANAQPKAICPVCGNALDERETRISDGFDAWHVQCYPPR
jgi:phage terminase large subunit